MNFTRDNYMIFCFHWPSPIIVWVIFFDKGGLAFRGLFIFFPVKLRKWNAVFELNGKSGVLFRSDHIWWEIWNYVIVVIRVTNCSAWARLRAPLTYADSYRDTELWYLWNNKKENCTVNEHKVDNDFKFFLVLWYLCIKKEKNKLNNNKIWGVEFCCCEA